MCLAHVEARNCRTKSSAVPERAFGQGVRRVADSGTLGWLSQACGRANLEQLGREMVGLIEVRFGQRVRWLSLSLLLSFVSSLPRLLPPSQPRWRLPDDESRLRKLPEKKGRPPPGPTNAIALLLWTVPRPDAAPPLVLSRTSAQTRCGPSDGGGSGLVPSVRDL